MYKASLVGIDNTGKTSIVKSFVDIKSVRAIHVATNYGGSESRLARIVGKSINRVIQFGEQHKQKPLTGLAYLAYLIPYYFAEQANGRGDIVVSDRDPIVDTLCYSDFYLPHGFSGIVRPPLKFLLERVFNYPDLFIYLEASPEVSVRRGGQNQLHERIDALSRLKKLFEEELSLSEKEGISVVRINTDTKPLEEVIEEVKFNLGEKSGINLV